MHAKDYKSISYTDTSGYVSTDEELIEELTAMLSEALTVNKTVSTEPVLSFVLEKKDQTLEEYDFYPDGSSYTFAHNTETYSISSKSFAVIQTVINTIKNYATKDVYGCSYLIESGEGYNLITELYSRTGHVPSVSNRNEMLKMAETLENEQIKTGEIEYSEKRCQKHMNDASSMEQITLKVSHDKQKDLEDLIEDFRYTIDVKDKGGKEYSIYLKTEFYDTGS